jgi:hypothetical protein
LIPAHNCLVVFTLAGVRAPRREEKFADVALQFTADKALHRDVPHSLQVFQELIAFPGNEWRWMCAIRAGGDRRDDAR